MNGIIWSFVGLVVVISFWGIWTAWEFRNQRRVIGLVRDVTEKLAWSTERLCRVLMREQRGYRLIREKSWIDGSIIFKMFKGDENVGELVFHEKNCVDMSPSDFEARVREFIGRTIAQTWKLPK